MASARSRLCSPRSPAGSLSTTSSCRVLAARRSAGPARRDLHALAAGCCAACSAALRSPPIAAITLAPAPATEPPGTGTRPESPAPACCRPARRVRQGRHQRRRPRSRISKSADIGSSVSAPAVASRSIQLISAGFGRTGEFELDPAGPAAGAMSGSPPLAACPGRSAARDAVQQVCGLNEIICSSLNVTGPTRPPVRGRRTAPRSPRCRGGTQAGPA